MTRKKFLVPVIVLVVLLATVLGIYIASNQAARPASDQNDSAATKPKELKITEIGRGFTVPAELGDMSYSNNGPVSFLLFSSAYDKLNGCSGKQIAELQLTNTQHDGDITLTDGQYKYLHLVTQPQGACGGADGSALSDAVSYMVATSRN